MNTTSNSADNKLTNELIRHSTNLNELIRHSTNLDIAWRVWDEKNKDSNSPDNSIECSEFIKQYLIQLTNATQT